MCRRVTSPSGFFFFFPGMCVTTSPYEISLQGLSFQRFPGREYFFEFFGGFRGNIFGIIFGAMIRIPSGLSRRSGGGGGTGKFRSAGFRRMHALFGKIRTRSDLRAVGIAMCALHAVIDGKRTFRPGFQKPPMRPEGHFGGWKD